MKKVACCLVSLLITILVVVGAVFGAGWYAYDRYAKDITGITYLEAWNVLSSLYGTKEDKIITNPFDADAELAAVDSELKQLLFLDSSVDFHIKDMLSDVIGLGGGTNNEGANDEGITEEPPAVYADAILGANPNAEISAAEDFLNKLKFDFSSLKNYDGEQHLFVMSDKQIGAVLNEAILGVAGNYTKGLEEQGVDIKSVLGVKDVKIVSDGELTANENTVVSAVVKLELQGTVEAILNTYQPKLKFVKGILPKALYLTIELKPFGEGVPTLRLNDNNDKENELILKMLNGILNYSKKTKDEDQLGAYLGKIDSAVKSTFKKLDEYLNIAFAASEMKVNPLNFVISKIGVDGVSDTDLLYMISGMMQTVENIENINWSNTKVDEFFNDFKSKMPIDKNFNLTLDNFAAKLSEIGTHIDLDAMNYDTPSEQMRITMNYDAVAGFVEKMLLSGDDQMLKMVKIRQIRMPDVKDAERDQLLEFIIEVKARDYLGLDTMESGLKKELLSAAVRDLIIDVTVSANGSKNAAVGIEVNGIGKEKTAHMLEVTDKLLSALMPSMAGQFSETAMIEKIEKGLEDALKSMKGDENAAALDLKFTPNGIEMQSIYEIIKTRKNITELTADEIRLTLKGVIDTSAIERGIIGEFDTADNGLKYNLDPINKTAEISASDAYIATLVKNEITKVTVTGGGAVELSQVLAVDLSVEAEKNASKLWNNETLKGIIEDNGMANDKIMLVTVKVSLNNEVFKQAIYLSVLYDISRKTSVVVVNSMEADDAANLEILINKLSGASIDLKAIANDVINKVLETGIEPAPSVKLTMADLLGEAEIVNAESGKLGTGVIKKKIAITL